MTTVIPQDERATPIGTPTQVANPRRAVIRTVIAAIVGLALVLNPVLGIVIDQLRELAPQFDVPAVVFVWLNGVIVITSGIIGGVTRILAVPGVNEWLARYVPILTAIPLVRVPTPGQIPGRHEAGS
jgi:hypothetical protein